MRGPIMNARFPSQTLGCVCAAVFVAAAWQEPLPEAVDGDAADRLMPMWAIDGTHPPALTRLAPVLPAASR